jgi:hypothetical protein
MAPAATEDVAALTLVTGASGATRNTKGLAVAVVSMPF